MLLAVVSLLLSPALAGPVQSVHAEHLAHPPPLPPVRAARPTPPEDIPAPERLVFGYYAPWAGSLADLDWARLTHVAVFNVDLNSDGSVSGMSSWDSLGPQAVALAAPHGVKIHLSLTCFDDSVMNAVLPNTSRRASLVATLADAVDRAGADGVSVDCEGVPGALRDHLTALVAELSAEVDEVSIATPAIDWSGAFDYAALSIYADQIFIMGYDYHWSGGDPGPVAPLQGGGIWSRYSLADTVDTYLSEGADPSRIVLGLPLYGRTWPTTNNNVPGTATANGTSVTMVEGTSLASAHGRRYDTTTDTPYTFISTSSQTWYDDHDSVQAKVHWAIEAGLGGVGFWALNYEGNDPAFWAMITEETTGLTPDEEPGGDSAGRVDTADDTDSDYPMDDSNSDDTESDLHDTATAWEPKGTRFGQNVPSCAGGVFGWLALLGLGGWARRRRDGCDRL